MELGGYWCDHLSTRNKKKHEFGRTNDVEVLEFDRHDIWSEFHRHRIRQIINVVLLVGARTALGKRLRRPFSALIGRFRFPLLVIGQVSAYPNLLLYRISFASCLYPLTSNNAQTPHQRILDTLFGHVRSHRHRRRLQRSPSRTHSAKRRPQSRRHRSSRPGWRKSMECTSCFWARRSRSRSRVGQ